MNDPYIKIRGASEHNLKNIDIDIPRDRLVVFTGVSGSGKSSLAFDTIYAEGQRRYMESLSSYARQFLGRMEKPKVTSIEGLSPAISIDQKSTNRNPRSTVGTVTEIYDYMRLLYARIGVPHCPNCGREIRRQTVDEMVDALTRLPERTRAVLLSPVVRGRKGEHVKVLDSMRKAGYVRVRIDGEMHDLDEDITLDKNQKHRIDVVIDRLVIREGIRERLSDSIENALRLSGGIVTAEVEEAGGAENTSATLTFSENYACPDCGISMEEIEPRSFSFNNPFGACPECAGLGYKTEFSADLMMPDQSLSVNGGLFRVTGWQSAHMKGSYAHALLEALAAEYGFSLDTPFNELSESVRHMLIYGTGGRKVRVHYKSKYSGGTMYETAFEGLIENVRRRYRECFSAEQKAHFEEFMQHDRCPLCGGQRLRKTALSVTVGGLNIYEMSSLDVVHLRKFLGELSLSGFERSVGGEILKEIGNRLDFLNNVGLGYLTLHRSAATLSGGEAQRIRLATQIGSGLVGVTYILDEPSIGLHQRDNEKLIAALERLRDLGNTVMVVEHDRDTMLAADFIVDIGPGAGEAGGRIVASGTAADIMKEPESMTGAYLSGRKAIRLPGPEERLKPRGFVTIHGAAENNLKNIDVRIPLGVLTVVTGVSGSGKSSLINEVLYKSLSKSLMKARTIPGKHDYIEGTEQLDKVILIDQAPIGRTPRSNPATYTGVFDIIRELFAATGDARVRGYNKGRFSFNVRGGRCEACAGDGIVKIEMHFLPDVYVPCEVCGGSRFKRETLEVRLKGRNISDVLNMTVGEALKFFENVPKAARKLATLNDVGLSYIKLGQPSTELSGGEAQRIKLAAELSRRPTGKTIYILDEPTTGLSFSDVDKLTKMLLKLRSSGNTVVVIEHNLDVIKLADHIIDLGPEGGDMGGYVIAEGTPEEVARRPESFTGQFLAKILADGRPDSLAP